MKRWLWVAPILAGVFSTGCARVVSIHPLYGEEAAPELQIEGRWAEVDGDTVCTVTRAEGELLMTYVSGKDPAAHFRVRPVRIGNATFLDVGPEKTPELAISGHWFARVELAGDELLVSPQQEDWVKGQCASGRLKCVEAGKDGDQVILISGTGELREVLAAPEAFGETGRFRRITQ